MIEDCVFRDESIKMSFLVFGGLRIPTSELIWVRLDSVCFSIQLREAYLCIYVKLWRKRYIYRIREEFSAKISI